LSLKKRSAHVDTPLAVPSKAPNRGTRRYFERGKGHKPEAGDIVVSKEESKRLPAFDKHLKAFKYKDALDSVLYSTCTSELVCQLLTNLIHRQGLETALKNRQDDSLVLICRFILRNITNPSYSRLLIDVFSVILDLYAAAIGESPMFDEVILKIFDRIREEIELQKNLLGIMGTMDLLIANK
jgi:U3 small nucleolar RNA-associated protein 15